MNFVYFERLMEEYGFVLLTESENQSIGLSKTNGSFEHLYRTMENTKDSNRSDYGKAFEMTKEEKVISFLNQYFIFKKARIVTKERLDKLYEKHVKKSDEEEEIDEEDKSILSEKLKGKTSFIRKIPDKKIVLSLDKYFPIKEESDILSAIVPLLPAEEEKKEESKSEESKSEEKEKEPEFGEYTEFFNNLKPEVQEKIRKYPTEKQMEILKKLQKPNKKVVTAK